MTEKRVNPGRVLFRTGQEINIVAMELEPEAGFPLGKDWRKVLLSDKTTIVYINLGAVVCIQPPQEVPAIVPPL